MSSHLFVALLSMVLSCFSQILLKKSSNEPKKSLIYEYLNRKVLCAYAITFSCMLLTIYAFRGLEYKYGTVIESLSYLIIMIMACLFLKERITPRKVIGNIIIVIGVVIFSIG